MYKLIPEFFSGFSGTALFRLEPAAELGALFLDLVVRRPVDVIERSVRLEISGRFELLDGGVDFLPDLLVSVSALVCFERGWEIAHWLFWEETEMY